MHNEKIQKSVWYYCSNCKKILIAAGGSTSGSHAHLKSQHQVNVLKLTEPDASTA